MGSDDKGEGAVDRGDLFKDNRQSHRVHSRAPQVFGDGDAEQLQRRQLRDQRMGERGFLIPKGRPRRDLPLCEDPDGFLKQPVRCRQREADGLSPSSGTK